MTPFFVNGGIDGVPSSSSDAVDPHFDIEDENGNTFPQKPFPSMPPRPSQRTAGSALSMPEQTAQARPRTADIGVGKDRRVT